jgi:hypothetical protein
MSAKCERLWSAYKTNLCLSCINSATNWTIDHKSPTVFNINPCRITVFTPLGSTPHHLQYISTALSPWNTIVSIPGLSRRSLPKITGTKSGAQIVKALGNSQGEFCVIWGFHGDDYEYGSLLGCCSVFYHSTRCNIPEDRLIVNEVWYLKSALSCRDVAAALCDELTEIFQKQLT